MKYICATLLCAGAAGCGPSLSYQSIRPVPELPPAAATAARGTADEAARLPDEDQVLIVSEVIRRFYLPLRGQARWIDPRPLAHRRSAAADSASPPEENRALEIVLATGMANVCPLTEANLRCRGLPGGVLRFSEPYALGNAARPDSARVFARYTPIQRGAAPGPGPGEEMEFTLARRDAGWTLLSRRGVAGSGPTP